MRDLIDLRRFWQNQGGAALALCTLVRKQNSSYRAVGAKKIVALDGGACGLLSGGCLESDIERTARDNWHDMPFVRSFTTQGEVDRLLGYQLGCAGTIDVLFERLPESPEAIDLYLPFGAIPAADGVAVSLQPGTLARRAFAAGAVPGDFFDRWITPVALTVVGCGADAPAFAALAAPLGWDLRFLDFRSGFTLPPDLPHEAEILPVDVLARHIPDGRRAAVMLMTHNYEADMTVLGALCGRPFAYVGCLGPRRRYEQMKTDLRRLRDIEIPADWERAIHAPAGLFNGRAPEEIALSVVAQIQSLLA